MLKGGFYRADFNADLAFISLNALWFSGRNTSKREQAEKMLQLVWLDDLLSKNDGFQYVIFMHIPPGHYYPKEGNFENL
jgi:hypothetical protein